MFVLSQPLLKKRGFFCCLILFGCKEISEVACPAVCLPSSSAALRWDGTAAFLGEEKERQDSLGQVEFMYSSSSHLFPREEFSRKEKNQIKYFPLRLKCVCAVSSPSTGGLLTSNVAGSRIRSFACGVLSSSLDTGLNNDFANINSSTPSHHLSSWGAEQPGFPWALLYFHRMNYSVGLQCCDIRVFM